MENFDITNLSVIFRNLKEIVQSYDEQCIQQLMDMFLDYVNDACKIRNFLMHSSCKGMTTIEFMIGLKYQNMNRFNDFKTCSLDPYINQQIDIIKT